MSTQTDRILAKLAKQGRIDSSDFPHDLMKFYGECSAKEVSLDTWNKIAISLYEQGESEKYNAIMHYISSVEMDKSIHDTPSGRVFKRGINNTAIQVLLAKASKEENVEARNGYMQQAIQTVNTSKIKDVKSQNYSIQGFINFYQNKQLGLTLKNLQNACVSDKSDIIDILGQGQVSFYAKDYAKALEFFKDALTKNPRLPGRARLGLAYCFYMQKKYELSKRAFQRVIDLDPTVLEAYLGLAVIAAQKQDWKSYVSNLNKAHELDKENPLVLYYVTEFYYFQSDSENVKKSAFKAINSLKSMPKILIDADKQKMYVKPHRIDFYDIKSRLYFMIGSCYHREKKLDLTQKFYEAAINANRGNIPANFGMAQIFIHNQQYDQAFKRLEEIRLQSPENEKEITFEVYKPLAYLLSKQALGHNKLTQQQYYQKALQYFPKDYEAQLEYANNLTDIEPAESLKYFKAALGVLQEKGEIIHQEIYNNIGVLELNLKNYPAAKGAFEKALEIAAHSSTASQKHHSENTSAIEVEESETKRISFLCTVKFNMGVMHEELYQIDAAITLFKEVLALCPYYLDAYVRLANIELNKGNFQLAVSYCDEALAKKEEAKNPIVRSDLVLCMKGYIQSQYEDDHSARDSFYMIKKAGFHDNYSKLYVSHMDYEQIIEKRDNYDFQKRVLMIGDRVKEILGSDSTNVQALMMLGVVLAENGQIAESKEILNVLKENIGVFPNIFFNLGQIAYLEKNYTEAILSYKKFQEKAPFGSYDQEYLMTQIALSYVHMDNFVLAKKTIKKLILQYPESLVHRYNYFMILHTEIEKVFSDQTRNFKDKETAFVICKRAREFLDFLKNDPKCKKSRYADHFNSQVKQKRTEFYNQLAEQCETKKLILDSNIVSFEKMLNEARHKQSSSNQNPNHFDDILRKWKIDQEIKKQKAEEEKRLAELKDAEKRNERLRKQNEIHAILEKQQEVAQNNEKKTRRSEGKSKGGKSRGGKKGTKEEEDDFLDDLQSDFNDLMDEDLDDISFGEEDEEMNNGMKEEKSATKDSSRKLKSKNRPHPPAAEDDDDPEDELIYGKQSLTREPPVKKKKKLLRKGRKNSTDDLLDELNDLDDPDNIFGDDMNADEPAAAAAADGNQAENNETKKPKRKAVIDDDDDDVQNIFDD